MSNTSFGLVVTSSGLEVWCIECNGIKYLKADTLIDNAATLDKELQTVLKDSSYLESFSRADVYGVYVPDMLKKVLVCGITKEGSVKVGEKLAKSLFLSPDKVYFEGNFQEVVGDYLCDVVVVSGGFNDSSNDKVGALIADIAESEWFKKNRPKVIYAGNKKSVSEAQVRFSPFTDFYEIDNILEEGLAKGLFTEYEKLDLCSKIPFKLKNSSVEKVKFSSYQSCILKLSDFMCWAYSPRVVTILLNDNYSTVNQCRFDTGKTVNTSISVSKNSKDLDLDIFSKAYSEFLMRDQPVSNDFFFEDDILPLAEKQSKKLYRPERIVGVSLSQDVDMKRFINLISDPDTVRGVVEFYFDNSGFFLICGSILGSETPIREEKIEEMLKSYQVSSGWLIIPDGDFNRNKTALEVYTVGGNQKNVFRILWGKRYTIPVRENSVVELRFKGSAYIKGRNTVVILKSGKTPKNLVVDVRKGKSL